MRRARIRLPVWWAAAFAIVLLWGRNVLFERIVPQIDNDSLCYAEGAQAVRLGQDPYTFGLGCYLYHPALATALSLLPEAEPRVRAQVAFAVLALSAGLLCAAASAAAGLVGSPWGLLPFTFLFTLTARGAVGSGNVALLVSLLIVAALLVLRRAPGAAGLLLAAATVLKSIPGLFLLYLAAAAIRRRDRTLGTAAGVGLALVAASMLLPWTREFFEVSSRMVDFHAGEMRNFAWVSWIHHAFDVPTPSPWPLLVAGALAAAALGLRQGSDPAVDWAILSVLTLAISPVSWIMGFTLLVLPTAVLLRQTVAAPPLPSEGARPFARAILRAAVLAATALCAGFTHLFWRSNNLALALVPMTVPLLAAFLLLGAADRTPASLRSDTPPASR